MNDTPDKALLEESMPLVGGDRPVPRWKTILDIVCVLASLPFLALLALLIALVIKIGSPGPVLFSQERVGYLGRRFKFFKFRTMVVGADTTVHQGHCSRLISSNLPMVKMDMHGDARVIPFGCWLRASGLDELPQFINVLRREMSLVGPRPCLPYEYERCLAWHRERFHTLPGLTGLWQVSGKNKTTFDEMMHLDIHYTRNKSLWLDVKIMLWTVPIVFMEVLDKRRRMKSLMRASRAAKRGHRVENNPAISLTRGSSRQSFKPIESYTTQERIWQTK
jgi:lipopolysaccharide/colanic/teichoic acid biosynthesis glycosyltransferase